MREREVLGAMSSQTVMAQAQEPPEAQAQPPPTEDMEPSEPETNAAKVERTRGDAESQSGQSASGPSLNRASRSKRSSQEGHRYSYRGIETPLRWYRASLAPGNITVKLDFLPKGESGED